MFLFRFVRRKGGDRGERKVSRKIGSLITDNSDYHQFDNVILKTLDGTTEIDHLLISPFGIFANGTQSNAEALRS